MNLRMTCGRTCGVRRTPSEKATFKQMLKHEKNVAIRVQGRGFQMEKEKAMAPHSSTLALKIPWTEEPVRLQSMGSLRVGHN